MALITSRHIEALERESFEALKSHAQAPSLGHAPITPLSELLAKMSSDTARCRFPKHLDLKALVDRRDGAFVYSRCIDVRIELPTEHAPIRPFPDYDAQRDLDNLLNLPWDEACAYAHGTSPVFEGAGRTSYAMQVDVGHLWAGRQGHTLLMHVDHRDGVAKALTVYDDKEGNFPARILFDTATREQRSQAKPEPRLDTLPPEVLDRIVNELAPSAEGALRTLAATTGQRLQAFFTARDQLADLLPKWIHDALHKPSAQAQETLQALEAMARGPFAGLLETQLEREDVREGARLLMRSALATGTTSERLDELVEAQSRSVPKDMADFLRALRERVRQEPPPIRVYVPPNW